MEKEMGGDMERDLEMEDVMDFIENEHVRRLLLKAQVQVRQK